MEALERDAFEVLRLVRSIKNSLAPINQMPPEVLSLTLDHCNHHEDRDLIALTHVCHGWRDIFISRSSLWTRLQFTNIDKTKTYIQRSQFSPLELHLEGYRVINDAFTLAIPHLYRVKSLTMDTCHLPSILGHIRCHLPLLDVLNIRLFSSDTDQAVLDNSLSNGDLSSLSNLCLDTVTLPLPWKMANLQVVNLIHLFHTYKTTQILDFFESAPLLHTISLDYPPPDSPDAPPGRIVHLRHLREFWIHSESSQSSHSTLLHHLHIPIGASLTSVLWPHGEESPLLDYLPERSPNFSNISHITTINIIFYLHQALIQLSGPSGSLHICARWGSRETPHTSDSQILRSLSPLICSTTQWLAISGYERPSLAQLTECPISQMFLSMNNLRTLVLLDCEYLPFILALDPEQSPSRPVPCPSMEELLLYNKKDKPLVNVEPFISMAKNRASRGVKLSLVKFFEVPDNTYREQVLALIAQAGPWGEILATLKWDDVPGVELDESEWDHFFSSGSPVIGSL